MAMIGANLRFGIGASGNGSSNATKVFQCHPGGATEATLIFCLGALGMGANFLLMALILAKRQLRRWSQGLLFHQAMVDCARAAILLPLGSSILNCQPMTKCSLVETAFLLLVTVSTVNMLTTVLNDSPIFPETDEEADLAAPLLMDSPQCVLFGTFMIWFASITINLGPTFLSGALAANTESGHNAPSCPLVHGPFRHYILNVLWIAINMICVALTLIHLRKLYKDLTKANVEAVTLHIAYIHAFANPVLFLSMHRGLRQGLSEFFCGCCEVIASWILGPSIPVESVQPPRYHEPMEAVPSPPEPPLVQPDACPDLTDVALLKPPLPPTGKHLLDDVMIVPPDPWTLVSRSKSTSSVYEEDISRRSSILLPPAPKISDSEVNVSPTSSDLPSE
ncbi:uncharacterized protein LOC122576280 isoform X5 [Bombus pyrosoma]|uniref:uncharacterized protein LOC122576280 isoform X5 n=1 Tax=Bombus pyrosoma TaxID=396416 RepID=UPI001CB9B83B|nr:uncharacterized protein LOC122576280 isoform X5 [Bombus pyrosoma]